MRKGAKRWPDARRVPQIGQGLRVLWGEGSWYSGG